LLSMWIDPTIYIYIYIKLGMFISICRPIKLTSHLKELWTSINNYTRFSESFNCIPRALEPNTTERTNRVPAALRCTVRGWVGVAVCPHWGTHTHTHTHCVVGPGLLSWDSEWLHTGTHTH
jgi:hypothetical protein